MSLPVPDKLPLLVIVMFAAAQAPAMAVNLAIGVFLPPHFAGPLGLGLATVGFAFFAVRLIDMPIDLFLGAGMDRTQTPIGRYRAWMLISAPILIFSTYMLFMAKPGIGEVFVIFWLLVLYLGLSIQLLSHSAWAATLVTGYAERAQVFGVMTAAGIAGVLTLLLGVPWALKMLGAAPEYTVQGMGWYLIGITAVCTLVTIARTPEPASRDKRGQQFRLADYWSVIARPTMARLFLGSLLLALGPGWATATFVFFFTASRGYTLAEVSLLLAALYVALLFGAPFVAWLAAKIGKHRAIIVGTVGFSTVLPSFMLLPQGFLPGGIALMMLAGTCNAAFAVMTRAMLADVSDEVRLEQGKEQTGFLFAITTVTQKVASALSIGVSYLVLADVGFNAKTGASNSPAAILGLELVTVVVPVICVLLGGLCFVGYNLTPARHAAIRRELDAHDAALSTTAAPLRPVQRE